MFLAENRIPIDILLKYNNNGNILTQKVMLPNGDNILHNN